MVISASPGEERPSLFHLAPAGDSIRIVTYEGSKTSRLKSDGIEFGRVQVDN